MFSHSLLKTKKLGVSMKKKIMNLLGIVLIIIIIIIGMKRPEITDLQAWMEETYDIECLDSSCETFMVFDEDEEPVLMEITKNHVSSSIFKIKVERTYQSLDKKRYYLDFRVDGFFDNFKILDESLNKINKI